MKNFNEKELVFVIEDLFEKIVACLCEEDVSTGLSPTGEVYCAFLLYSGVNLVEKFIKHDAFLKDFPCLQESAGMTYCSTKIEEILLGSNNLQYNEQIAVFFNEVFSVFSDVLQKVEFISKDDISYLTIFFHAFLSHFRSEQDQNVLEQNEKMFCNKQSRVSVNNIIKICCELLTSPDSYDLFNEEKKVFMSSVIQKNPESVNFWCYLYSLMSNAEKVAEINTLEKQNEVHSGVFLARKYFLMSEFDRKTEALKLADKFKSLQLCQPVNQEKVDQVLQKISILYYIMPQAERNAEADRLFRVLNYQYGWHDLFYKYVQAFYSLIDTDEKIAEIKRLNAFDISGEISSVKVLYESMPKEVRGNFLQELKNKNIARANIQISFLYATMSSDEKALEALSLRTALEQEQEEEKREVQYFYYSMLCKEMTDTEKQTEKKLLKNMIRASEVKKDNIVSMKLIKILYNCMKESDKLQEVKELLAILSSQNYDCDSYYYGVQLLRIIHDVSAMHTQVNIEYAVKGAKNPNIDKLYRFIYLSANIKFAKAQDLRIEAKKDSNFTQKKEEIINDLRMLYSTMIASECVEEKNLLSKQLKQNPEDEISQICYFMLMSKSEKMAKFNDLKESCLRYPSNRGIYKSLSLLCQYGECLFEREQLRNYDVFNFLHGVMVARLEPFSDCLDMDESQSMNSSLMSFSNDAFIQNSKLYELLSDTCSQLELYSKKEQSIDANHTYCAYMAMIVFRAVFLDNLLKNMSDYAEFVTNNPSEVNNSEEVLRALNILKAELCSDSMVDVIKSSNNVEFNSAANVFVGQNKQFTSLCQQVLSSVPTGIFDRLFFQLQYFWKWLTASAHEWEETKQKYFTMENYQNKVVSGLGSFLSDINDISGNISIPDNMQQMIFISSSQ